MALARINLVIQDDSGNIVDGASVTVRSYGAGMPLAGQLYSDRDGATPIGNPFTAADGAAAGFYLVSGIYEVTATKGGFSRTWPDVAAINDAIFLNFDTRALAAAAYIPAAVTSIRTNGFYSANDGGGCLYVRQASAGTGSFQSLDLSQHWAPAPFGMIVPEIFGAKGNDATAATVNDAAFTDYHAFLNANFVQAVAPGGISQSSRGITAFGYGKEYYLTGYATAAEAIQACRKFVGLGMVKFIVAAGSAGKHLFRWDFDTPDTYARVHWSGATFCGAMLTVKDDNDDQGRIEFQRCEFVDCGDTGDNYAIYLQNLYSTVAVFEDCHFIRCNGSVKTDADITYIKGGWALGHYLNLDNDKPQFKQTGQPGRGNTYPVERIIFTDFLAVPVAFWPAAAVTITIASPAVVSHAAHGRAIGDALLLTTTGALPTGLNTTQPFYIIAAGFTADSYQVSATRGGAAVNTSGTQNGVHSANYYLDKARWVDVNGTLESTDTQWSGEFGGMPVCKFLTPYEAAPDARGGGVRIAGGHLYVGPTATGWGAIMLGGYAPAYIKIDPLIGPLENKFVVNDPVNWGGIADWTTYWSDWETATGQTDRKRFHRYYFGDQSSPGQAFRVPDPLREFVRTEGPRELLTFDRTLFVNGATGSDFNSGRSSGDAWATIQHAVDHVATMLDLGEHSCAIQVADATYTETVTLKPTRGLTRANLIGNTSTPANCVISVTGGNCIEADGACHWFVRGFKLSTTTSGDCIQAVDGAKIDHQGIDFGACAGDQRKAIGHGSKIQGFTANTVSGNAITSMSPIDGGSVNNESTTETLIGTPAFTYFAYSSGPGSSIVSTGATYAGSGATGKRHRAERLGAIYNGGSDTFYPGDAAGEIASGGVYNDTVAGTTGALGTMAEQDADAVAITGGTVAGLTSLAVGGAFVGDFGIAEISSESLSVGSLAAQVITSFHDNLTVDGSTVWSRARGTKAAPTQVTTGTRLGGGFWRPYHSGPGWGFQAAVLGYAAEDHTNTARGTYIAFDVTPLGSATRAEGARAVPLGIRAVGHKRVTSQFDKTDSTLANVTGLSVNVEAGKTYRFRASLDITSTSATPAGHKYAIAGTCTATAIAYRVRHLRDSDALYKFSTRVAALGGAAGITQQCNAGQTFIDGYITVNATGTLTVQFAQNVTDATAASVLVGSPFEVEEVA